MLTRVFLLARRSVAIALGVALTGYSAWVSWHHTHDVLGPLAAVSAAILLALCEYAWRDRQWIRFGLLGLLGIAAAVISGSVVLERVSATSERATHAKRSDNLPRAEAQAALAEAQKALSKAEASTTAECSSGRGPPLHGAGEAGGRGPETGRGRPLQGDWPWRADRREPRSLAAGALGGDVPVGHAAGPARVAGAGSPRRARLRLRATPLEGGGAEAQGQATQEEAASSPAASPAFGQGSPLEEGSALNSPLSALPGRRGLFASADPASTRAVVLYSVRFGSEP